eukprot:1449482-Prymnesium_polylepis.1
MHCEADCRATKQMLVLRRKRNDAARATRLGDEGRLHSAPSRLASADINRVRGEPLELKGAHCAESCVQRDESNGAGGVVRVAPSEQTTVAPSAASASGISKETM